MRNRQLKPAYNVHIEVNSEYITGIELFSDRNDVKTLRPFLRHLEQFHHAWYDEVVTDGGYESLDNYLYLHSTDKLVSLSPATMSKEYKKQIGRVEDMEYNAEKDYFIRVQGRRLSLWREYTELQNGQLVSNAWYRCENCDDCP